MLCMYGITCTYCTIQAEADVQLFFQQILVSDIATKCMLQEVEMVSAFGNILLQLVTQKG